MDQNPSIPINASVHVKKGGLDASLWMVDRVVRRLEDIQWTTYPSFRELVRGTKETCRLLMVIESLKIVCVASKRRGSVSDACFAGLEDTSIVKALRVR
jgi:hypothetical protein